MELGSVFHNILDEDAKLLLGSIQIVQNIPNNPIKYSGRGFIQYGDSKMTLNLFPFENWRVLSFGDNVESGQIIPNEIYYSLFATDFFGYTWESKRIKIYLQQGNAGQLFIVGDLFEVKCEKESVQKKGDQAILTLFLQNNIRLPSNEIVTTEIRSGGEVLERREIVNAYHFISGGLKLFFYNSEKYSKIQITARIDQMINVESRICEALEFILGKEVSWFKYQLIYSDKEIIRIHPLRKEHLKNNFLQPVREDFEKDQMKLFDKYFQFILSDKSKGYAKLSRHHHRILKAATISLEAEILALAISIEKISKSFFPFPVLQLELSLTEDLEKLKRFRNVISSELMKNQINYIISQVKARNNLQFITKEILETPNLLKKWKSIRNSLAHGDLLDYEKIQLYVNDRHSLASLYYQLNFLIIQYTGKFTDYSPKGFPQADFAKSLDSFI